MRIRNVFSVGALVVALATMTATAQQKGGPATPTATPLPSVRVGSFDYDVDPAQPVIAYVVGRTRVLSGDTTVTVELLLQTGDGWRALPPYQTEAVGPLADAQPGDALVLSDKVVNGGQ